MDYIGYISDKMVLEFANETMNDHLLKTAIYNIFSIRLNHAVLL